MSHTEKPHIYFLITGKLHTFALSIAPTVSRCSGNSKHKLAHHISIKL